MTATFSVSQPVISWAIEQAKRSSIPSKSLPILESWLEGDKIPTYNKIRVVSQDIHVPFGYFFLNNPPEEKIELLEYRTIRNSSNDAPSRDLIETIRDMEQVVSWTRNYLLENSNSKCEIVGAQNNNSDIEFLTKYINSALELDEKWFSNSSNAADSFRKLREKMSNLGIVIMTNGCVKNSKQRTLDINEFRGFTIIDEYAPLIFINNRDSDNGKLFTLMHEFVHICLGKNNLFNDRYNDSPDISNLEKKCNQITSEILVPHVEFEQRWEKESKSSSDYIEIIRHVSSYFRCSMLVIAKRAYDTNKIKYGVYEKVYGQSLAAFENRKKSDTGPGFYKTLASHMDKRFFSLLYSSVVEGKTSYTDAFSLTNTNRNTFEGLASRYELT